MERTDVSNVVGKQQIMKKKLMFVVHLDWAFMSHRLPIALEAMRQGYEVHIATGITNQKEAMENLGLIVHPISMHRSSANPIGILRTFFQIVSIFRKVSPALVHLVTIKPVLLGSIAARLVGVPAVVAAIPGLGSAFLDKGFLSRKRRAGILVMYRVAFRHQNLKVIFQNNNDRDELMEMTDLKHHQVEMIRGSGVDLDAFKATPLPSGIPVVILAARLIADKGVWEFIEAARLLHKSGIAIRCCLVGTPDLENPSSLTHKELRTYEAEGIIELWGHRVDMANVLQEAHIVVLPSYREGMPKILLEAAAAGRAVITADVPGCRDAIDRDVSGVLVPVKNAEALALAINALLADRDSCVAMGRSGRALAEKEFDVHQVVTKHLRIYAGMIGGQQ
jgi:glycosyltransferase involved in cell wall biosynthesis